MAAKLGSIKPNKRKSPNQNGEWLCSVCGEWKLPSEYNKNKSQKSGLHYSCRSCAKRHVRKYNLPSKYGITLEKYDSLLASQTSKCAICEKQLLDGSDNYNERPVIDHNHKTNEVRELLCYGCNLALGNVGDSSEYALRVYTYLKKWNC
jgi:hypothetical protein